MSQVDRGLSRDGGLDAGSKNFGPEHRILHTDPLYSRVLRSRIVLLGQSRRKTMLTRVSSIRSWCSLRKSQNTTKSSKRN